jgi:pteridine reductase
MRALHGKTVLVTGAARRIGRTIALACVDAGSELVAHFHSSEREAQELRQDILSRGGQCWLVRADLERSSDVESLIERACATAARPIDALVNNAAIFPTDTLASVSPESIARCLAVNAWAPLVLCRAFAKQTSRGHVINFLDEKITGYRLSHVSYQVSKQVLALLTRMLAIDLAPGIVVNAIAPGLILPPPGRDESWLEPKARASVPLARPGTPEEIADAALFLLSCDYLTGQIVYVDGGRHLLEPADGPHSH